MQVSISKRQYNLLKQLTISRIVELQRYRELADEVDEYRLLLQRLLLACEGVEEPRADTGGYFL